MNYLLVVILGVYLSGCVLLYSFQRSLIYFPQPRTYGSPATTATLKLPGVSLSLSVRPHQGPKALIYFGGNAEDVSRNLPAFSAAFPEYSIYLLHYRGYGESSGEPSEEAIHADALALFDKVHAEHANITIVGRSLGSGVAIRLASERPVDRLVLVTPYNSLQELAARQFRYFPIRWWILKDKFESWRYAPRITAPTLLVAAEYDEVIPRSSTEALFRHFVPGSAQMKIIRGTGHNSISGSPEYIPLLKTAP
ncbi:MAG TPA: alpha/beta fold hydrolase [Thermoanaerobaculia bacterium]|jgi:pimeloyl-ACP methyl ester carboxylesterase|nr:alpha/beta fold hydrolase [Thermoanaerobaculia bacterium]